MHAFVHQEQFNMEVAPYIFYKLNNKATPKPSSSPNKKAKIGIKFSQSQSSANESSERSEGGFVPGRRRNNEDLEGGWEFEGGAFAADA